MPTTNPYESPHASTTKANIQRWGLPESYLFAHGCAVFYCLVAMTSERYGPTWPHFLPAWVSSALYVGLMVAVLFLPLSAFAIVVLATTAISSGRRYLYLAITDVVLLTVHFLVAIPLFQ